QCGDGAAGVQQPESRVRSAAGQVRPEPGPAQRGAGTGLALARGRCPGTTATLWPPPRPRNQVSVLARGATPEPPDGLPAELARGDALAPDVVGDLDDQFELGHFLVVAEHVALDRGGEAALRRQA